MREPSPPRAAGVARRLSLTLALLVVLVVVAIATGTAWTPATTLPFWEQVGFGVPAMAAGRWWTPLTGSFLAVDPLALVVLLVFVAVGVGACEWLLGTRRTAGVVAGLQLAGVMGGTLLAWLLSTTGWPWAVEVAGELDGGLSAGALGAAVVASAALRPPWRGRVRLAVFALVLTSLVFLGYLADLIHVVAIVLAWPLGTRLAGRHSRPRLPSSSREEVRKLSAAFFLLSAVLSLLGTVVDREGPLGRFGGDAADPWAWLTAALYVAIGAGLLRGRRLWWRWAVGLTGLTLALVLLAAWLVPDELFDASSGLFLLNLFALVVQLSVLVFGRAAFRNPGRRAVRRRDASRIGGLPSEVERQRAIDVLTRLGSPNRLSWIATWSENRWWFPSHGDGMVAYQLHSGVAIGLGDPVAPADGLAEVADGFVGAVRDAGLTPCVFSGTASVREWALERGWVSLPVAQEAVIDLPGLEFKGKKWQDIRTALNQAPKNGIEYRMVRLTEVPRSLRVQVHAISEEWVGEKELPEMGFTLGGIEEAADPRVWVSLAVDADATVHGFTSWLPAYGPGGEVTGWTLDVMRRSPDSFRYTMEFLIASACVQFRDEGYRFVSLSGAPLAQSEGDAADPGVLGAVVTKLADAVEPYYGFGSLERFKEKFMPRHEPLYLVAEDEAAIARAGVAVGRAYLAHATPGQLLALVRPPERV